MITFSLGPSVGTADVEATGHTELKHRCYVTLRHHLASKPPGSSDWLSERENLNWPLSY